MDTTGQGCHLALIYQGECYLLSDLSPQSHAKQILPLLAQLLADHHLTLDDIAGIVYTQGPGAFTGIRIGISVVQGLALACNIPTLGISSLQALAWQAVQDRLDKQQRVLVAIDARMQQVYWAIYQFDPVHRWQMITPEAVGLPTELPHHELCVGDGIALLSAASKPSVDTRHIQLDQLWQMVEMGLSQGWLDWSNRLALPVYLRPESALISNK